MTRQQVIAKFYDDLEAAERYKDKQMDEPRIIAAKFQNGQVVRMCLDPEAIGHVTGVLIRPHGVVYLVTWAESRDEFHHYDFELEAAEQQS